MEVNYMTRKTWNHLDQKLQKLKEMIRPGGTISKEIGHAASYGDLSENAEWEMAIAKKEMLNLEAANLQNRLANAVIIDTLNISTDRVMLGTKVTLYDLDTDKEVVYQILGGEDAEFYENVISVKSPIAQGLMGKRVGDEVKIKVPDGVKTYEIVKIERFS
ncbi:MAG TPA: transcription elongation factor GreA [Candidatus Limnocylindrales bacterium]|nr:transcription elongation factor GreA [Candidatus Limnocylindrales bacterium]